jgi:hypothetical protein
MSETDDLNDSTESCTLHSVQGETVPVSTASISNMIGHLNWQSLADRRSDACLVLLYMISHELVAILKTDILVPSFRFFRNMHSLSYQIPPTCCMHLIFDLLGFANLDVLSYY